MPSDFRKGPNYVHPEVPSAVGSRNSLNRDRRDEYTESRLLIDEEVEKLLNHIQSRLPPEVLEDITVQGNVKSYLHDYMNQSMQNMVNRYLSTSEDEMSKKVRDLIDKEEHRGLTRYTSREIVELVSQLGDPNLFNTSEVEKSSVNIMGHLQGHVHRGVSQFESATVGILTRQSDVSQFISGNNSYGLVQATIRDNYKKPGEVMDIKLSINVLNSELISGIYPYQIQAEKLIKTMVAQHIQKLVDKEIDEINAQLDKEDSESLSPEEAVIEKIKHVENYLGEGGLKKNKQLISTELLERFRNIQSEINRNDDGYDPLIFSSGVYNMFENEALLNRGWNTAVNSITTILDNSKMGYQQIENYKLARHLIIREYEENNPSLLPDERFEIEMRYLDTMQLREYQSAYTAQLLEFQREVTRLQEVVEEVYKEEKKIQNVRDWDDVVRDTIGRFQPVRGHSAKVRNWDEITFVRRKLSKMEEIHRTYEEFTRDFTVRFRYLKKRLEDIFERRHPEQREILEQRINFLENAFVQFSEEANPYQIQPGLLIELRITSIKRRRVTVRTMGDVLNQFFSGLSIGFSDPHALRKHRRSNVMGEDILSASFDQSSKN